MKDFSHRGARPFGPTSQPSDRRVVDAAETLRLLEAVSGSGTRTAFARDPGRGVRLADVPVAGGVIAAGTVVHALPYVNWYRVQLAGGGASVAACMLAPAGLSPAGPREIASARPLDSVLVFHPPGLAYAVILGVLPRGLNTGSVVTSDWLVQGGGSGLKREAAHRFPMTGTFGGGGVIDFSSGRPLDATAFERGWVTPTGLLVSIDDAMIQVRVNERAGLWMTLCDDWVRLAGGQLLIESGVHAEEAGDDEGEARLVRGVAAYPWEAIGLYAPGPGLTAQTGAKEVQYTAARAALDLPAGATDVEPVYRYREFGGYLGQGHVREVVRPAGTTGVRRYADETPDEGLFREAVGLDGSYTLVSAKSLHIGKRVKITVPRPVRPPEHGAGDDAAAGNYKFSGTFGAGDAHVVGEVAVPGEFGAARRVAGVMDLIAYDLNWKALHPFHYHAADYLTRQEAEATAFDRAQGTLDFRVLATQFWMADPEPVKLHIDHRYGDVSYYERESFIRFNDDGSVHLGCGYGAELAFAGGRVRVAAPGGIDLVPGTDLVVLADQIVLRAHNSIDVTSAQGDVRVKAEGNMQFLSNGGMLLESNGEGLDQRYAGRFGEDVEASGIVIRANRSAAAVLGQDVYVRSGGEASLGDGDILLDAGKGTGRVQATGREFNVHAQSAVTFNFGPTATDASVRKVYSFGEAAALFDVELFVRDKIVGYGPNSGVVVRGSISATRSIASAGKMADKTGGALGKVPDGFESSINQAVAPVVAEATALRTAAADRFRTSVSDRYYAPDRIGNDDTLPLVRFGYRDPPGEAVQYGTVDFAWPESRWQLFARFGLGEGGEAWDEPAVVYQGEPTYPWPGRKAWKDDDVFLRLPALALFDPETGCSRDRPDPYVTSPALADWDATTMAEGFRVTRS